MYDAKITSLGHKKLIVIIANVGRVVLPITVSLLIFFSTLTPTIIIIMPFV